MNAYEQELTEEEFESILNDTYGNIEICGMTFNSGRALKELDPIAFRCALNDYESNENEKWFCSECNTEFDNEEEAEECCQEESEE